VGSKLIAYNTDIIGFEQSFTPLLKPTHNKALVLGTGGASKAVQYVLNRLEILFKVVTRSAPVNNTSINYSDIDDVLMDEYRIIINCTPVGMWPNESTAPELPYHLISNEHYLYDLVYKPAKTIFLQKGEERGAMVKNGNDMLLIQAEASWKIWNSD
ncbi:MAG: shikimate dehydrogenase, partial [Ferruginibacter sp.]